AGRRREPARRDAPGGARLIAGRHRLDGFRNRHDPHVRVHGGVRVSVAVAHEGDPAAVRAPDGRGVVVVAEGELTQRLRCNIEDVDVRAAAVQVTLAVALELDAVDDPGLRAVAVRGGIRARLRLLIRITDQ